MYLASFKSISIFSASSFVFIDNFSNFTSPLAANMALKGKVSLSVFASSASMLQYSTGINLLISSSLSHTSITATDCTLPAESPIFIFFHKRGESL